MLWTIYSQAKELSKRPSEILNVEEPYTAYCLDEAVMAFGRGCEAAMDSVKTKGKKPAQIKGARENMLRRFLGIQRKFADIRELQGSGGRQRSEPEDRPEPSFRME